MRFFFDPTKLDNKNELYGCSACGLYQQCISPRMEPFGNFNKEIMLIAQAPGENEDKQGRPLCGKAGKYLESCLDYYGINMDEDCLISNCLICRPPNNRKPKQNELESCFPRLDKLIKESKPKLIIIFGEEAIQQVLNPPDKLPTQVGIYRGYVTPSRQYNAWVAPLYHPSYVNRSGGEDSDIHEFFMDDLDNALSYLSKPISWPIKNEDKGNHLILDANEAINLLTSICGINSPVAFDYETNTLYPYNDFAKILTISFATSPDEGYCIPLWHRDNKWSSEQIKKIENVFRLFLKSNTPKWAQNINFETICSRQLLNIDVNNIDHDSMVGAHVLDDRRKVTSLDFQSFIHGDSRYFVGINHENLDKTPLPIVSKYNVLDSRYTWWLCNYQKKQLIGNLGKAYKIFNDALPLFADLNTNGMKVDLEQFKKLKKYYKREANKLEKKFLDAKPCKEFKIKYGHEPAINGRNDGIKLFYDICGTKERTTKKGNLTLNEDTLIEISGEGGKAAKIAKSKLDWSKYQKMLNTFVPTIEEWVRNEYLHPTYHLHVARSFRSASSDPNVQQVPKRNPEAKKLRKAYIPRHDFLLEMDYSGNEVRHLAMLSLDKNLIKFLKEGRDFHSEWAARIKAIRNTGNFNNWKRWLDTIDEDERFEAKNSFVFASFYLAMAKSLAGYLRMQERKIKILHGEFWEEFAGVKEFQEEMVDFYNRNGYIELATGFRRHGPIEPRKVANTVVQGPAFHTLLVNLTETRDLFRKDKLDSKIITQTHDSALFDVVKDEEEFIVDEVNRIMTTPIWDWQKVVPLVIEWEKGNNWYEMEKTT